MLDGRVIPASAYRPSSVLSLEAPGRWWTSLTIFGGLVLVGGPFLAFRLGEPMVLVGVAFWFLTVGLAAVERTELATAVGGAGLVFVAVGIGLVDGTVSVGAGPMVGMVLAGLGFIALGLVGRARHRRIDPNDPGS